MRCQSQFFGLSVRGGDDVLCHRRLFRQCEDQKYPLRSEHDASRGPDLCVRGGVSLPDVLSIAGSFSCRAVALLAMRSTYKRAPHASQQILDKVARIEEREVVKLFAGADEACGNSEFILDCHHNAAFAAAIEFGHDQAS